MESSPRKQYLTNFCPLFGFSFLLTTPSLSSLSHSGLSNDNNLRPFPIMATLNRLKAQRSYFTGNTSEENAQVLAEPNPTYKFMYLDIGSVGATARDILAFGKANWSNFVPNVCWNRRQKLHYCWNFEPGTLMSNDLDGFFLGMLRRRKTGRMARSLRRSRSCPSSPSHHPATARYITEGCLSPQTILQNFAHAIRLALLYHTRALTPP